MEKLKTLKDVEFRDCGRFVSDKFVSDKLKQEAIKWYRYHEEQIKLIGKTSKEDKQVMRMMSINGWLWNFFNITEEDLK